MSKKILRVLVFIMIFSAVTTVIWIISRPVPIILQGEVEASKIDVSTRLQGQVEELFFDVGNNVKKGERLLQLKNEALTAKLAATKAQLDVAKANRDNVYSTRPETIKAQKVNLERAQADVTLAKQMYDRINTLKNRGIASKQDFDEVNNKYQSALKVLDLARANLELAVKGSSTEAKLLADKQVQEAQAAVKQIEVDYNELTLLSPVSGQIVSRVAEIGQRYNPGTPLFSIIDTNNMWITFDIREDLLQGIKIGDELEATFPALNNLQATVIVTLLNAQGQYANWRATKATGDFDLKTFEMRVKPKEPITNLRPGMSVNIVWQKTLSKTKTENE